MLTKDIQDQIIALRKQGHTLAEIIKSTGQTDYHVYQTLLKAGLVERGSKGPRTSEVVLKHEATIKALRVKGFTYSEIASKLTTDAEPLTESQVGNVCRAAGIRMTGKKPKATKVNFSGDVAVMLATICEKQEVTPEKMLTAVIRERYRPYANEGYVPKEAASGE